MAKKSITKNYIYNLIYQVLIMIVPLITTPYLSRVLGAENIGIYSYTLSITTYFVLLGSLGIATYGSREIAYVRDDKYKMSKSFWVILIVRFICLCISMIIFYFSFCQHGEYNIYYKILLLELLANCIDISWFFQGLEEFKKTVSRNSIIKILGTILIFVLVKSSKDLKMYFIIYVLSNFIGNMTLWFYLPKYINKIKLSDLKFSKHIKPAISLFIPQIAINIYAVLDKTMIGTIVTDKSQVGFYEQAQKIIRLLLALATSLGTVLAPRIANIYAKGEYNKIKEYLRNSFSFILFLAFPIMFGIISIASKFVPMFYGPGYQDVIILIKVISPIIVFVGLSNITGIQYLLPTKQHKKYTISVICGALINFILNLMLIRKYESIGASIATVFAEFSVTFIQLCFIKKEIKMSEIVKLSYKYLIASTIMFFISIIIGKFIKDELISICTQCLVSIVVYIIALIAMRDEMILKVINLKNKRSESKQ